MLAKVINDCHHNKREKTGSDRLTFYFGLTKNFLRMMKMIFLATGVLNNGTLMSCDFSNIM